MSKITVIDCKSAITNRIRIMIAILNIDGVSIIIIFN